MANKRMFTMKVCDSDAFLDMPLSTQCLYFHLNMRADDDGFIGNAKRIQRLIGASDDDLKLLIVKRFVLEFDGGIIVIKHWRMHNTLSQNRYHETQYLEEKDMLRIKENGSYSLVNGEPLNDLKLIESSSRQCRRTKDVHETDTDLDLDKDIELEEIKSKKRKEDKPTVYYPADEQLNQTFLDYISMRKQIKKPMTPRAIELAMKELQKLASVPFSDSMDNDLAIQILEQSIMNSWLGLFPLKQEKKQTSTNDYIDKWRDA